MSFVHLRMSQQSASWHPWLFKTLYDVSQTLAAVDLRPRVSLAGEPAGGADLQKRSMLCYLLAGVACGAHEVYLVGTCWRFHLGAIIQTRLHNKRSGEQ